MESVDVQAVVDKLASSLGLSVLVEDIGQHPVWWSTLGEVDGTRMKTILDRRVEPRAAAVVQRFKLTQVTSPVHVPAIPEADMWARWCMPLRHEDAAFGLLWVLDRDGVVGEDDLAALEECAEVAAEEIARRQETAGRRRRTRDELINRLLAGPDREAAGELVRAENLPAEARVQVEAPGRSSGWPLPNSMSAHVEGMSARTATSGDPVPLVELAEAVRRAAATRRVVDAGARLDSVTWDDLGAWRLIVDAPDSLCPEQLHPGAGVLLQQPWTELVTTARIVLDHGGEISAAAAELHVHRTTLYYRLNRITELIGVDLRSGPSRLDLQMALRLAAYRGANAA